MHVADPICLSAVVVARDEAELLPGCLRRLGFVDEVVVAVDDRTIDASAEIAAEHGARVVPFHFESFARAKQHAVDAAKGQWVLVVDADERVTEALADEIRGVVSGRTPHTAYRIPIRNFFFGGRIDHPRWREAPVRLFRRRGATYVGDIHETLEFASTPSVGDLTAPIAHFSHRSIRDNLAKTRSWADLQAQEMLAQGHPRITAWRLVRLVASELVKGLVMKRQYRDGTAGVIEALYQPFSTFCVHVRLWELQQQPSIEERYRRLDEQLR